MTGGELEELVSQRRAAARGHRRAHPRAGRGAPDRPRARGPPLGRRGDARRAAPAGAQGRGRAHARRSPATATTSSTAPTRSRSSSASWPRRARSRGSTVPPLSEQRRRRAGRSARDRRAASSPPDQRQPVLRHRGARGGHGRDPAHRARRGARARRAALAPRRRTLLEAIAIATPQAEVWLLEALAARRARRIWSECLASGMRRRPRRRRRRSATSSPASPSRRRSRPTAGSRCIARRRGARRAAGAAPRIPARIAHHADARRRRRRRSCASRRRRRRAPRRSAPTARPPRSTRARCASPTRCARGAGRAARAPGLRGLPHRRVRRGDRGAGARARASPGAAATRSREGDCLRSLSRLYRFVGRTEEAAEVGRRGGRPPRGAAPRARAGARLRQPRPPVHESRRTPSEATGLVREGARARRAARRRPGARLCAHQHRRRSRSSPTPRRRRPSSSSSLELAAARRASRSTRAAPTSTSCGGRCARTALRPRRPPPRGGPRVLRRARPRPVAAVPRRVPRPRGARPRAVDEAADSAAARPARPPHVAGAARLRAHACSGWCGPGAAIPTSGPLLDEALALAEPTGELQRIGPVGRRAGGGRVAGRSPRGGGSARPRPRSSSRCAGRRRGRSASSPCWRRRAGHRRRRSTAPSPRPTRPSWPATGRRAAELWTALGCPYEAALALAGADDDGALRAGARRAAAARRQPAAAIVARRLRERGVRRPAARPARRRRGTTPPG